jgi:ATP-dependent Clp protease ATP-binding subunit ClpX
MKILCSLCEKNKKHIIIVNDFKLCKTCIKENITLEQHIELQKIIQNQIEQESDSLRYNQLLTENNGILDNIKMIIEKEYSNNILKEKYKKDILEKVEIFKTGLNQELDPRTIKNLNECLNSLSFENLEEVSSSVNKSGSLDDLVKIKDSKKIQTFIMAPNPRDLFDELNKHIINQEQATKAMSIAIVKHACRMKDKSIEKNNILILGPTGTGKTEICRILATETNIPFSITDSTTFTQTGYQGKNAVDSIIMNLIHSADGNIKRAEEGIVFIDEFDKKAAIHSGNASDVGTTNVQHELLKLIEGGSFSIEVPDSNGVKRSVNFNTENVLFIAAGAFSGIEHIVLKNKKMIGLTNKDTISKKETENIMSLVDTSHLKSYGLIPELLGRFSVITYTNFLNKEDLVKILLKERNSLVSQYKKLFSQYRINIYFDQSFLIEIASEAVAESVGARGLKRIFEKKMTDLCFNIFDYVGQDIIVCEGSFVKQRKPGK